MNFFFLIRNIGMNDVTHLGLDSTNVAVEEVPLLARSEIIQGENVVPRRSKFGTLKRVKMTDVKFTRVD